jgi:hypothetical protein
MGCDVWAVVMVVDKRRVTWQQLNHGCRIWEAAGRRDRDAYKSPIGFQLLNAFVAQLVMMRAPFQVSQGSNHAYAFFFFTLMH